MPGRGGASREIHRIADLVLGVASSGVNGTASHVAAGEELGVIWDGAIFDITSGQGTSPLQVQSPADILQLYLSEGPGFVSKLNGAFALVLWDVRQRKVLLARDPMGSKPLFYSKRNGDLIFASEVRGLLQLAQMDRAIDLQALQDYLTFLWVPAPRTLLRGVSQIAPGEVVTVSHDGSCEHTIFRKPAPPAFSDGSLADWSERLRELVAASLRRRVSSSNRLGFLLSGGTDTATLVGCAAKELRIPVRTYTLGFPDAIDERKAAKETAQFYGNQHFDFEVDENCIEQLPKITCAFGTPVGNSASLIAHALFAYLKDHVDQLVCGDGGNEILGGSYKYNQTMNFAAGWVAQAMQRSGRQLHFRLRETPLEPLFQYAARFYFSVVNRAGRSNGRTSQVDVNKVANFYARLETCWSPSGIRSLCTDDTLRPVADYDPLHAITDLFVHDENLSVLQQLIYVRTNTFIPYNAMPYVDFNASANKVDCLFPLLDQQLLDFIYRVPFDYMYGKSFRYLMQKSFAGRPVPPKLFRKPSNGFQPPRDRWMQVPKWQALVDDHLSKESVTKRGLFSPAQIDALLAQYRAGNSFLPTEKGKRAQPVAESIWSLLALEVWCREFLDNSPKLPNA